MGRAFTLSEPCRLYLVRYDDRMPSESIFTESWHTQEFEAVSIIPNPCQSTGVWYLEPKPAVVAFMRALVDRIAYHAVWQWDQTAFNEVILHFLWGTGEHEPLRYRLLPFSEVSNIGEQTFWMQ